MHNNPSIPVTEDITSVDERSCGRSEVNCPTAVDTNGKKPATTCLGSQQAAAVVAGPQEATEPVWPFRTRALTPAERQRRCRAKKRASQEMNSAMPEEHGIESAAIKSTMPTMGSTLGFPFEDRTYLNSCSRPAVPVSGFSARSLTVPTSQSELWRSHTNTTLAATFAAAGSQASLPIGIESADDYMTVPRTTMMDHHHHHLQSDYLRRHHYLNRARQSVYPIHLAANPDILTMGPSPSSAARCSVTGLPLDAVVDREGRIISYTRHAKLIAPTPSSAHYSQGHRGELRPSWGKSGILPPPVIDAKAVERARLLAETPLGKRHPTVEELHQLHALQLQQMEHKDPHAEKASSVPVYSPPPPQPLFPEDNLYARGPAQAYAYQQQQQQLIENARLLSSTGGSRIHGSAALHPPLLYHPHPFTNNASVSAVADGNSGGVFGRPVSGGGSAEAVMASWKAMQLAATQALAQGRAQLAMHPSEAAARRRINLSPAGVSMHVQQHAPSGSLSIGNSSGSCSGNSSGSNNISGMIGVNGVSCAHCVSGMMPTAGVADCTLSSTLGAAPHAANIDSSLTSMPSTQATTTTTTTTTKEITRKTALSTSTSASSTTTTTTNTAAAAATVAAAVPASQENLYGTETSLEHSVSAAVHVDDAGESEEVVRVISNAVIAAPASTTTATITVEQEPMRDSGSCALNPQSFSHNQLPPSSSSPPPLLSSSSSSSSSQHLKQQQIQQQEQQLLLEKHRSHRGKKRNKDNCEEPEQQRLHAGYLPAEHVLTVQPQLLSAERPLELTQRIFPVPAVVNEKTIDSTHVLITHPNPARRLETVMGSGKLVGAGAGAGARTKTGSKKGRTGIVLEDLVEKHAAMYDATVETVIESRQKSKEQALAKRKRTQQLKAKIAKLSRKKSRLEEALVDVSAASMLLSLGTSASSSSTSASTPSAISSFKGADRSSSRSHGRRQEWVGNKTHEDYLDSNSEQDEIKGPNFPIGGSVKATKPTSYACRHSEDKKRDNKVYDSHEVGCVVSGAAAQVRPERERCTSSSISLVSPIPPAAVTTATAVATAVDPNDAAAVAKILAIAGSPSHPRPFSYTTSSSVSSSSSSSVAAAAASCSDPRSEVKGSCDSVVIESASIVGKQDEQDDQKGERLVDTINRERSSSSVCATAIPPQSLSRAHPTAKITTSSSSSVVNNADQQVSRSLPFKKRVLAATNAVASSAVPPSEGQTDCTSSATSTTASSSSSSSSTSSWMSGCVSSTLSDDQHSEASDGPAAAVGLNATNEDTFPSTFHAEAIGCETRPGVDAAAAAAVDGIAGGREEGRRRERRSSYSNSIRGNDGTASGKFSMTDSSISFSRNGCATNGGEEHPAGVGGSIPVTLSTAVPPLQSRDAHHPRSSGKSLSTIEKLEATLRELESDIHRLKAHSGSAQQPSQEQDQRRQQNRNVEKEKENTKVVHHHRHQQQYSSS